MIGKSLKEIKDDRNLTSLDIAKHMNCTEHTVNKWLRDVNNPTLEDLDKLADYLQVSVDYLMGITKNEDMYPENTKIKVTDEELLMITTMREISAKDRREVEHFIEFKIDSQHNKRD